MTIFIGIIEQGMIYAILALGVYITYSILDVADLSVDGTFPLGAAVSAVLITRGMNPALTLLVATAAGAGAGFLTGVMHVKCGVRALLAGIITMTALYSVNLRIAGTANLPLFQYDTVFKNKAVQALFPGALAPWGTAVICILLVALCKVLLDRYLKTKAGYLLRAVGDNPQLVTTLAQDSGTVKIIGLTIANALVALSGAVMAQQQRFFEESMGTGAVVIGLASVIIGVNIYRGKSLGMTTLFVIIGSVLYKASVAAAIALGMEATDMKLITAVLFFGILMLSRIRKRKGKGHAAA